MKLTFWGAAKTVTGSMHHIESGGREYLLDCGLYQGRRQEAFERNSRFPFAASSIEAVILSHAHIDHSGNLPTLVHNGFSGPIYTTPATIDLCLAMLADSAYLQQKDAEFCNKRRAHRKAIGRDDRECVPLYTLDDAERTYPLFRPVQLGERKQIAPGFAYTTYDAGHMLGSTSMILEADGVRLAYSGDVGRPGLPIIRDPQPLDPADYLIIESTYGDRLHQHLQHISDKLADIVTRTAARGGRIIVPSFAVGRTQQLVLLLHQLIEANRIPSIPIYVDSPLAVNVTDVFRKHPECYDQEARDFLQIGEDPFGFHRLRYIRDVNESKALNDLHGPFVVISASGMCEAGRILHHLREGIEDARNTILIVGYQAQSTLGRRIVERQREVKVFGVMRRLAAEVVVLNGFSAHADQKDLIEFAEGVRSQGKLRQVLLVHGEPPAQTALIAKLTERGFSTVHAPGPDEKIRV